LPIQFDTTGLEPEYIQSFEQTITELDKHFNLQRDEELIIPFNEFELFKHYHTIELREAFRIADGRCNSFISFMKLSYGYMANAKSSGQGEEYQIWGAAKLPNDYGHIIIKRENLAERFSELFQPVELNFPEDREFCRKHYVLASQKEAALRLLNQAFRNELKRILISDFYLEILNEWLIIGNRKLVDKKEGLAIASFVFNVSELEFN
jgi:hypothetical protein